MSAPEDQVQYSKREHIARVMLQAIGTGYTYPADESLIENGESLFSGNPRAVKAVEFADRVIEIMKSKRRTWPDGFLPS
jgi:hypothetical protein